MEAMLLINALIGAGLVIWLMGRNSGEEGRGRLEPVSIAASDDEDAPVTERREA